MIKRVASDVFNKGRLLVPSTATLLFSYWGEKIRPAAKSQGGKNGVPGGATNNNAANTHIFHPNPHSTLNTQTPPPPPRPLAPPPADHLCMMTSPLPVLCGDIFVDISAAAKSRAPVGIGNGNNNRPSLATTHRQEKAATTNQLRSTRRLIKARALAALLMYTR